MTNCIKSNTELYFFDLYFRY